jgi:hypothetical protein
LRPCSRAGSETTQQRATSSAQRNGQGGTILDEILRCAQNDGRVGDRASRWIVRAVRRQSQKRRQAAALQNGPGCADGVDAPRSLPGAERKPQQPPSRSRLTRSTRAKRAPPASQRIAKRSDRKHDRAHCGVRRLAAAFPKPPAPPAFSSAKRHHDSSRHQKPAVILRSAFRDEESHPCSRARTETTKQCATQRPGWNTPG